MPNEPSSTSERILQATVEVLVRSGPRRLSLSDVATAAGVSRPTLYRWFPTKDALLDAFGRWEQHKYDAGIAAAVEGLVGDERLDAALRYMVEFQHSYSLRRLVEVEPEHVLAQMARVLPIMQQRLEPHFAGANSATIASIVTRIALSHALLPDDDPDQFLRELRTAAGLAHLVHRRGARSGPRRATRTRPGKTRA